MKHIITISASVLALGMLCSFMSDDKPQPITSGNLTQSEVLLDCDTVVVVNGYSVRMIRDNGEDIHTGLNLFSDEMKKTMDHELLDRIEKDLYELSRGRSANDGIITKILKGTITDFRSVSPETDCSVSTSNSKNMVAEWSVAGKPLRISIPISYETAKGEDRTLTENHMISRIKGSDGKRKSPSIDKERLEAYGDDMFMHPGATYHSKDISQNIYLDSKLSPVWDVNHPTESIADLFLFPSDKCGKVDMELTVLKHEYGKKETFTVPVDKVLAEFEKDGCQPYWGIERFSDGKLEGSLFLYNPRQGYDHVIKIECVPADVINGTGVVEGRASLFIPTNNVDNLHAPYVKKSEKERIRYDK